MILFFNFSHPPISYHVPTVESSDYGDKWLLITDKWVIKDKWCALCRRRIRTRTWTRTRTRIRTRTRTRIRIWNKLYKEENQKVKVESMTSPSTTIVEQLFTYLDDNNLIHRHQYGFRKHHSTEYAALHIVDYVYYKLDLKKIPIILYLDLSKAFDSLLHEILLKKLQYYGICGAAINLMASYLKNRKQFVQFKGYKSDMKAICNGVSQGSILGPLLFCTE